MASPILAPILIKKTESETNTIFKVLPAASAIAILLCVVYFICLWNNRITKTELELAEVKLEARLAKTDRELQSIDKQITAIDLKLNLLLKK